MGKFLLAVVFLVIGIVVGAVGGIAIGGGGMMGAGVATGLSTGVCMTVEAATDLELITPEQADQILNRAAENISGMADIPEDQQAVNSVEACESVMEKIRAASN